MKEKLSYFHAAVLIFMIQTGMVLFRFPQMEAEFFGTNGWLAIFLCSAAAFVNIGLIAAVYRLGQGKSIYEILERSIPKAILFPFYLSLLSIWSLMACLSAKEYVVILHLVAFPTQNPIVFKIFLDLLAFYLISKGIYNLSKAATVFFFLTIWMVLLLFYFYGDFSWTRMTPFVFRGAEDPIQGFFDIYQAFLGYELCLVLFPYADPKTKVVRATYVGNTITTVIYVYIGIICFGFYSFGQLKQLLLPVLELLAYVKLPFLERIENLFYGFFLFSNVIAVAAYLWSASETGLRIVPKLNRNVLVFLLIGAALFVSEIPDTFMDTEALLRHLSYIETGIAFGLPLVLIPCALMLRKKEGTPHVYP